MRTPERTCTVLRFETARPTTARRDTNASRSQVRRTALSTEISGAVSVSMI
jgi:hypothetical protein